jgi:type VI secretion system secreted protein Hcp
MWFRNYKQNYGGAYLSSESQVDTSKNTETLFKTFFADAVSKSTPKAPTLFEIDDFSFGIEQTLNIGSQSTGAGAGKITFNPFSITRKIDRSSPQLFSMSCAGQAFEEVVLGLRKSSGGQTTGQVYLVFRFKLVAVKTLKWEYDDESPKETVEFEYGGLQVHYAQQSPDGSMKPAIAGGWNRVKNVSDEGNTLIQ